MTSQNLEARLRRQLRKQGYGMSKAPSRHWTRKEFGAGYMVFDERDIVVLGALHHPYDASISDVQEFLQGLKSLG